MCVSHGEGLWLVWLLCAGHQGPSLSTLFPLPYLLTSYSEKATFPIVHSKQQDRERKEEREEILPVPGSALGPFHHNLMILPLFIQMRKMRLQEVVTQVCLVSRLKTY